MKRKDRASVLIFCVILMAAVGTIVLTTADLGRTVYRRQALIERDAKFDYALDGLVAVYGRRLEYGDVIVPTTEAFDVGGLNFQVDLANGTGARSRFVDLAVSLDIPGYSRKRTYALGNRGKVSPTWFALGTTTDFIPTSSMNVTGDVYFAADISLAANSLGIVGDIYAQRTSFGSTPTCSGNRIQTNSLLGVSLDSAAYKSVATSVTSGNQLIKILAFLSIGTFQTLLYNDGDVTFDCQYLGKGTVFVNGNVTIDKLDKTTADNVALVIVNGNVEIRANNVDAFIICSGNVTYSGLGNLQLNGGVWASQILTGSTNWTITHNSLFWGDPKWDKLLRVPGMW